MSETKEKRMFTVKEMVLTALFAAIIVVCTWITIPVQPVPFTLQTFAVFCAVSVLGGKKSFFSVLTYILLGMVGIPVFSGFSGGISVLFGKTGGYIVGFLFIPLIYMLSEKLLGKNIIVLICTLIVGLAVCYIFGTAWFIFVYSKGGDTVSVSQALKWCVIPFIPFDLLKMALAVAVSVRVKKLIEK